MEVQVKNYPKKIGKWIILFSVVFVFVLIVSYLLTLNKGFESFPYSSKEIISKEPLFSSPISTIIFLLGVIAAIYLVFILIRKIVTYLNNKLESNFNKITPKKLNSKPDIQDEVYSIISDTYESLSVFRKERERQAKNSYNIALSLIFVGILIIFGGVFLLFKESITEGVLTAGIGGISNILGGTIINFYKETNNRMDKLNDDLFVLNTAKVQYSIIDKISDQLKRDEELSKLIVSIGNIKKAG